MDYMELGVRSRKTGINAKQNIERDEYSMENIDEFFNDDTETTINTNLNNHLPNRNELSSNGGVLTNPEAVDQASRFKIPKFPYMRSSISRRESSIHDFGNEASEITRQQREQNYADDYFPEDNIESNVDNNNNNTFSEEVIDKNETSSNDQDIVLPRPKYTPKNDELMGDEYTETIEQEIKLTPNKLRKADYRDVPELIADDENDDDLSRNETSFNTSDNAILENEIKDDSDYQFELLSEEDRDYVQEEVSSEEHADSGDDSFSSDDEYRIQDRANKHDASNVSIQLTNKKRRHSSFVTEDSDEEYIQSQAAAVLGNKEDETLDRNKIRRSNRIKVAPLEYWRNEKIVYKRKTTKPELEIEKIVTHDYVDEDEAEAEANRLEKQSKQQTTRTRPYNYVPTGKRRGRPRKPKDSDVFNPNKELLNDIKSGSVPNSQWLKRGILEANINVSDSSKNDEIVAFAPNLSQSEQVRETKDENFSLEVMFDKHKEHFASGMLKLPMFSKKKLSESYNTFMTFYVIQGVVEVTLSNNKFIVIEGSSFQVPAFNQYAFENKGMNEVKMFFVQVTVDDHFNEKEESPNLFQNEDDSSFDFENKSEDPKSKVKNQKSEVKINNDSKEEE
ncbi:hypothetical protein TPHA_0G03300 [Tetrapisispora phaffii CBS 4417]|uniref:CENP-C homolog n=1 Tax=Tetrapisispora phaffii (strain ATCC 24235 / CBS 4417 / NBRC 1672 / NRRL Y-8282 / UCD 70-5) TaxID=1071381 RepID=G8BW92_TETPH|nr:hypothetical protein TPHA_0G03300 [Tetrapisispora phaffii CBS 4417]CCE64170.1 hypothetical protein TPHA_0G03300 [Tetrapisispora phaffii CBS 4417]